MRIQHLFVNHQAAAPLIAQTEIALVAHVGIVGDRHAQIGSPRQVLLIDQGTLARFGLAPGVLRENIVCDAFPPQWESGRLLHIGTAIIRPTFLCEPCRYLNTIQPGLAKQLQGQRGWLGMVVQSGQIAVGDRGVLLDRQWPPLPQDAKGRFFEFVARIPPGKVVTTADLVMALGVSSAHYRVLPMFIKQAIAQLPVHRIVAKDGGLLSRYIPQQAALLQAEGVWVEGDRVSTGDRWLPEYFHAGSPPMAPLPALDSIRYNASR